MNATILNGERINDNTVSVAEGILRKELSLMSVHTQSILLREKKITRCMGCFDCWVKTPGICVIDDYGRDLARIIVNSDLIIYLTPVTFGGYSSELKKAIDRFSCPMLLPYFMKIQGEVHHKTRYSPLPSLIGIGILSSPDEASEHIFRTLVKRNGINLHSPISQSAVFHKSQEHESIGMTVRSLIKNAMERR